jgi:N-acetylglucosaminyldiphosphoundecaprenol N-acetyl-beta-D-mannosaminyltransferase
MNGAGGRREVLGIPIDALTIDETVTRCAEAVDEGDHLRIGVVNAAKVVNMRRDPRLRAAVLGCDLVLADGQSVVWASRILGRPLPERVAGIDLLLRVLPVAAERGYRVYLLGARDEVLERAVAELVGRFPGLKIAGTRNGYFTAEQTPGIVEDIRSAGADLLFLGMSSPKKELFVRDWGERTGAHVVHGVGGSLDVLAGEVRRAPVWWQRHGIEWLYRALQEPRRLGPRYLTTNTRFVALVASELLRGRGGLPRRRRSGT